MNKQTNVFTVSDLTLVGHNHLLTSLSISSHLIGHHVEEVVVHATVVHSLSGRHPASNLLFLGNRDSTFGHILPGQTGLATDRIFTSSKGLQRSFR